MTASRRARDMTASRRDGDRVPVNSRQLSFMSQENVRRYFHPTYNIQFHAELVPLKLRNWSSLRLARRNRL